ncbi:hypothetical protein D3C80_2062910 [compost metagenome]
MGILERIRAGLEQVVQRAGKAFLVFREAVELAGNFDGQTLVGCFQELCETHGEFLCCSC